jgi:hypothetical protein
VWGGGKEREREREERKRRRRGMGYEILLSCCSPAQSEEADENETLETLRRVQNGRPLYVE